MIRDEREKQNLSQAEVAVRVGKPQSWVAKTEAGGRRLDVVELLTLLGAMGVNVESFMRRLRQKILNKD